MHHHLTHQLHSSIADDQPHLQAADTLTQCFHHNGNSDHICAHWAARTLHPLECVELAGISAATGASINTPVRQSSR
ncbi:hypothetical protein BAUCODRAFT_38731 [Baudoinia panamericana UAMH 10762]|uniref:Uncharacterized protein n=1 Tax=Baudoinia panamericana (strain UAMH 10762) TaxID=717646 RepID=M2MJX6_BAUPA|nr:uncharacterized protein BAUCODRAFT_38731 [Baudoinia panamericana UAMH 10762]EMC91623.1 hypothetical protein BAUCODRAFT_38731 [Baudoinia panamericana UAMH 10762]